METEDVPPTTLNPAPEAVALEIMTEAVPVFVIINVCELFEPVAVFPKLTLVALAVSVPALVNPTQPERVKVSSRVARTANHARGLCCPKSPVATR